MTLRLLHGSPLLSVHRTYPPHRLLPPQVDRPHARLQDRQRAWAILCGQPRSAPRRTAPCAWWRCYWRRACCARCQARTHRAALSGRTSNWCANARCPSAQASTSSRGVGRRIFPGLRDATATCLLRCHLPVGIWYMVHVPCGRHNYRACCGTDAAYCGRACAARSTLRNGCQRSTPGAVDRSAGQWSLHSKRSAAAGR